MSTSVSTVTLTLCAVFTLPLLLVLTLDVIRWMKGEAHAPVAHLALLGSLIATGAWASFQGSVDWLMVALVPLIVATTVTTGIMGWGTAQFQVRKNARNISAIAVGLTALILAGELCDANSRIIPFVVLPFLLFLPAAYNAGRKNSTSPLAA